MTEVWKIMEKEVTQESDNQAGKRIFNILPIENELKVYEIFKKLVLCIHLNAIREELKPEEPEENDEGEKDETIK